MLGRPEADPHGDPIPESGGARQAAGCAESPDLSARTPVTVTRVIDQDKAFLRFIEQHNLKPGESIEVEDRDAASDSVRVRGKDDRRITIGTRAASKLLVERLRALLLSAALARFAQRRRQRAANALRDHRQLLSRRRGVQPGAGNLSEHLRYLRAGDGAWVSAFTQEWPLFSQAHQFSYTLTLPSIDGRTGLGDTAIHYRLQVSDEGAGGPAFSPRISLLLPTGNEEKGLSAGTVGYEINLPVSKQIGNLYLHERADTCTIPSRRHGAPGRRSGIWRVRPMLNLMLEACGNLRTETQLQAGTPCSRWRLASAADGITASTFGPSSGSSMPISVRCR